MAKFYGSAVKMGRVGGSVFSIRNGVTIERQYQPNVLNPNTRAQVIARAKLKVLSQLAAILAPILGFRRMGLASPRNIFVKRNYESVTYEDSKANLNLTSVDVSGGLLSLAGVTATRVPDTNVITAIASVGEDIDCVLFAYVGNAQDELRLLKTDIVDVPAGATSVSSTSETAYSARVYVIAYGFRANTEAAKVIFGNLTAPSTDVKDFVEVVRSLPSGNVTLTETRVASLQPA